MRFTCVLDEAEKVSLPKNTATCLIARLLSPNIRAHSTKNIQPATHANMRTATRQRRPKVFPCTLTECPNPPPPLPGDLPSMHKIYVGTAQSIPTTALLGFGGRQPFWGA